MNEAHGKIVKHRSQIVVGIIIAATSDNLTIDAWGIDPPCIAEALDHRTKDVPDLG